MNKKLYILLLTAAFGLASCGFEDTDIVYDYTSVMFPYQDYNRNIIVGEGLSLDLGVTFAGVINNKKDRLINYTVDPTLINDASKTPLPAGYYSCATSQIIVPKNELKGYMRITLDSAAFLADAKSLTGEFILPVRLLESQDVDSVSPYLGVIRIAISYYARQHGYYTYSGSVTKGGAASVQYANNATLTDSRRFLNTVAPDRMRVVADATNKDDPANGVYSFIVQAPVTGSGAVSIIADDASPLEVKPDEASSYDADTKTFTLNYSYTLTDGTACKVSETLVYRNRIRDVQPNGLYINEWR
ncbi:MAG: DUF1735 domain-containing protein [Tannerella sp.]|jgi:hypothetical protein|nr:DUF1735 domain-containing protein [Tannerella sp.]